MWLEYEISSRIGISGEIEGISLSGQEIRHFMEGNSYTKDHEDPLQFLNRRGIYSALSFRNIFLVLVGE